MRMTNRTLAVLAAIVIALGAYDVQASAETGGNGSFCAPPRVSCAGYNGWQDCFDAGYGTNWSCADDGIGNAGCGGAIKVYCNGIIL